MISLQKAIEISNYHITGGADFLWNCFGENSRWIDFQNDDKVNYSIVFDTVTQTVYKAVITDYEKDNNYLIVNPDYMDSYVNEAKSKNVEYDCAYDDVKYTILECVNDFIEKATAIINGYEYDERISIPLDLTDEEFINIAKQAHKQDITINKYIENAIEAMINEEKIE